MATRNSVGTATSRSTALGRFRGRLVRQKGAAHVILRMGAGLLFMQHGAQKLFGWLGGVDGAGATVDLLSQMGLAGVLEFFGGLMIVVGLFTRPVAVILLIEMVWAYAQVHAPMGWAPLQNQGELALLYALIWLYLATSGAGPASIDHELGRRGTRVNARH